MSAPLRRHVSVALLLVSLAPAARASADLFEPDNLVAWCIVPFDARHRGPEERAAMLESLGIHRFAYDWRDEHLPQFEAELGALKEHHIELTALWFPGTLDDTARMFLEALRRHDLHPQLWVTGEGEPTRSAEEQRARVAAEAARIRPIAEAAAAQGCKVALYNHGGWFGEPENQLAVIDALGMDNVGIVYNLHHGHPHIDRLPELLSKMKPHLLAINLNGMVREGDKTDRKILVIGEGDLDLQVLRQIRASGWSGPVGILNHTSEDAATRLKANLDGLAGLRAKLAEH